MNDTKALRQMQQGSVDSLKWFINKYTCDAQTPALISENGEILITSLGMEIRIQDMEFLQYDTIIDADGDAAQNESI